MSNKHIYRLSADSDKMSITTLILGYKYILLRVSVHLILKTIFLKPVFYVLWQILMNLNTRDTLHEQ